MGTDLVQGEKGLYELSGKVAMSVLKEAESSRVSSRDSVAGLPDLTP